MGIVKRLGNVVRGGINSALDGMEDPEKMIGVCIEDLRTAIADAKRKVTDALAEQKLLKNTIGEARASADNWLKRAEQAVKAGQDDLAQMALEEKNRANLVVNSQTPRWKELVKETNALKEGLRTMELRLQEILQNRDSLIAKAKVAKARSASAKSTASPLGGQDNEAAFSRAEEKIKRMEAKADATREMAIEQIDSDPKAKFAGLDQQMAELDVKSELEALKAKLGK